MSSDADYASFLDKANQDTSAPKASSETKKRSVGTKSVDTKVPEQLEKVEEYYVSDADEPFEPVSLQWTKDAAPSAGDFGKLIGRDATEIKQKEFDPKGQYKQVLEAVREASGRELKFFKVELEGTRLEYFVVAVDNKEKRLVGMKALAVES